jgi:hypothetical protein
MAVTHIKSKAIAKGLEKYWLNNGPFINDPLANAIHFLRRYNFKVERGEIFPPVGFEFSKEDRSAVEYLVLGWDYEYHPKP